MAKETKPKKPRAKKYDDKLAVKGSFLDVVKASIKHAKNKPSEEKEE